NYMLRFELQEKENHILVNYQIWDPLKQKNNEGSFQWQQFDEVILLGKRMFSELLGKILGEKVRIGNLPLHIKENINAYHHFANGLYQFQEKNYSSAIQNFNSALQINPFLSQAHFYKGKALMQQQEYEQAEQSFLNALPEVSQSSLVDWEVKLDPDFLGERAILGPVILEDQEFPNKSPLSFVRNKNDSPRLLLIDIRTTDTLSFTIPGPLSQYSVNGAYSDDEHFLFIMPCGDTTQCFLRYNRKTRQVRESGGFSWIKVKEMPLFYGFRKSENRIYQYDISKPNDTRFLTVPLPSPFYFDYLPGRQAGIVYNDSAGFLLDFKKGEIINLSNNNGTESHLKFEQIAGRYLFFTGIADQSLYIYDEQQRSWIQQIPLTRSEPNMLRFYNLSKPFRILPKEKRLFTVKPDNKLYIYELAEEIRLLYDSNYPLDIMSGTMGVYSVLNNDLYGKESFFIDWQNGQTFIMNPLEPNKSIYIAGRDKLYNISLNLADAVYLHTRSGIVAVDKTTGNQFWELKGFKDLLVLPHYSFLILVEENGNRLAFYNFEQRVLYGYYQFPSLNITNILGYNSYLFYLDKYVLKRINISYLLQNNPVELAEVYHNLALTSLHLKHYENGQKYLQKILTELKPNDEYSRLLQFKMYMTENRYTE
ncbi:MAG: hypothetical protein WAN36_05955, partial [Calditrichia bacterium]